MKSVASSAVRADLKSPSPNFDQDVSDAKSATDARPNEPLSIAVTLREDGVLIGDCTLFWSSFEHRQGEIGFVFNPAFHGRGYGTEAARVLLELAFDGLRLHRVIGLLEARNRASAALLERLGMRREAHLIENEYARGEWQSELVYALLESEWRALS